VQSKTSSASTSAVSECNRAISACSRLRLSESSEQAAALAPAAGVAFAATESKKTETATSTTPNPAQTTSRVARACVARHKVQTDGAHDNTPCVRIKEREAARVPRKVPYALRNYFGEVGEARLHSWGCRRWNSPVAPKPKRFDRDSPRPHRRTLHSEWGMLKTAEIAELGEPPPSAQGNARIGAACFAPA
jgi:hypothetical protein